MVGRAKEPPTVGRKAEKRNVDRIVARRIELISGLRVEKPDGAVVSADYLEPVIRKSNANRFTGPNRFL
jgi:hypothetical protein